ncbi:cysteine hydrolase family protein [Chondrinema litorale]|uniref:cysteine hydrolase family protein n=1 Tax=Chondrinema litorale TaxID=2994555 RepID=UPI00254303F4|nr:isochorismatase family cysteine hydrolase [Chondrinema litorale]UZR96489.1 cysteine hydrolase [Chondrinema litorale]
MNKLNASTAILVMDMQNTILGNYTKLDLETIIQNVKQCINKAKEELITIIYVVLGFRKGFPEVNKDNKMFSAFKENFKHLETSEISKIHPEIAPNPEDIIVKKHRVSAFSGSDLEMILRAANINHLVLTGVATSGVVLSTFAEAFDKDYSLTVISDACTDRDDDVHKILTEKVFPRRAEVVTTEEWIK